MLAPDERTTGFLEFAKKSPDADKLDDAGWKSLADDGAVLGLFGLLTAAACTEAPAIDPGVRDELEQALNGDLADALGDSESVGVGERMDRFVAAKGERGPDLLARTIARVIYEVYDLNAHRFVQDDAVHACDLLAYGGAGQDAREAAKRVLRISRFCARSTLGHLDGQVEIVHKLADETIPADFDALDTILDAYAPRMYAQRLPSIAKSLVTDAKFRFVVVLWARLRGIVIGRSQLIDLGSRITPRKPMLLIQALVENAETRDVLRKATETCPLASRIEQAFLAR
jgi:hypothetical protein